MYWGLNKLSVEKPWTKSHSGDHVFEAQELVGTVRYGKGKPSLMEEKKPRGNICSARYYEARIV